MFKIYKKMKVYPKALLKNCVEKILNQMNHSMYKINEKEGKFETGFFCYIKYEGKKIPVMVINKYLLEEELNDTINISINNKIIKINLEEIKYKNKDYILQ